MRPPLLPPSLCPPPLPPASSPLDASRTLQWPQVRWGGQPWRRLAARLPVSVQVQEQVRVPPVLGLRCLPCPRWCQLGSVPPGQTRLPLPLKPLGPGPRVPPPQRECPALLRVVGQAGLLAWAPSPPLTLLPPPPPPPRAHLVPAPRPARAPAPAPVGQVGTAAGAGPPPCSPPLGSSMAFPFLATGPGEGSAPWRGLGAWAWVVDPFLAPAPPPSPPPAA